MKRFAIARLLAVFIAATFTCSAAHATDVALTGDAHVSLTRSTTNFGTLANLYVGNGNTALLQFDLSTLPAGLTAGQISRATLTVFVNRVNTGGTVSLSPVTSAWSESAVTYATIPAIGPPVNGFTAATAGQYVTLDVTSLVQGWVTAPATNFGLALTSTVANVLLDSKENDETGHAATLDITVTSIGATGPQGPQGPAGVPGTPGVPGIPGSRGPCGGYRACRSGPGPRHTQYCNELVLDGCLRGRAGWSIARRAQVRVTDRATSHLRGTSTWFLVPILACGNWSRRQELRALWE